jgi:NAD(P)-dependent dehydrogenase (short-subunit alcohol dehydrogenase family)
VLVGDLASMRETRELAQQVKERGPYDAVIHNVGVGYQEPRIETPEGLEHIFAINVMAPYLLTALIPGPKRLIYLSSGMHRGGSPEHLNDAQWKTRRWSGAQAYSDSKFFDAVLAFAVARLRPQAFSNAVEPGWVPTKMGGRNAPDDLRLGAVTQAWLATSNDPAAQVSGEYFYHQNPHSVHPAVRLKDAQDALLRYCAELSGTPLE